MGKSLSAHSLYLYSGTDCRGQSLFHMSIERVYLLDHMLRGFACSTAYLIRPTESNDPGCGKLPHYMVALMNEAFIEF